MWLVGLGDPELAAAIILFLLLIIMGGEDLVALAARVVSGGRGRVEGAGAVGLGLGLDLRRLQSRVGEVETAACREARGQSMWW